ncbi:at hook motif-containing protein [Cyclospora cayetanensis]|uniref:glutathione synthase n=1 Tax=Cyclospora cayetanensis TaxID=88456 RepID=A0A1D3CWC5_9EIME|nr:at hook motif-containing protein [Cyclospora cayetanensis]
MAKHLQWRHQQHQGTGYPCRRELMDGALLQLPDREEKRRTLPPAKLQHAAEESLPQRTQLAHPETLGAPGAPEALGALGGALAETLGAPETLGALAEGLGALGAPEALGLLPFAAAEGIADRKYKSQLNVLKQGRISCFCCRGSEGTRLETQQQGLCKSASRALEETSSSSPRQHPFPDLHRLVVSKQSISLLLHQAAVSVGVHFNVLIDNITKDPLWLQQHLQRAAACDSFLSSLLGIMQRVYMGDGCGSVPPRRIDQDIRLHLLRADYMLDTSEGDFPEEEEDARASKDVEGWPLRLVEVNTIAVSFAGLGKRISQLHAHLVRQLAASTEVTRGLLPDTRLLEGAPSDSVVCPENNPGELNVYDQLMLQEAIETASGAQLLRVSPQQLYDLWQQKQLVLLHADGIATTGVSQLPRPSRAGRLLLRVTGSPCQACMRCHTCCCCSGGVIQEPPVQQQQASGVECLCGVCEVSLVLLRSLYDPAHFCHEGIWLLREILELSDAVKVPSVPAQLAGTKKVQQLFSPDTRVSAQLKQRHQHPLQGSDAAPTEDVLERFLPDAAARAALQAVLQPHVDPADAPCAATPTHSAITALEASTVAMLEDAVANPLLYLLKPQREGGGNNIYGQQLQRMLQQHLDAKTDADRLGSCVLVRRMLPPVLPSLLTRSHAAAETLEKGALPPVECSLVALPGRKRHLSRPPLLPFQVLLASEDVSQFARIRQHQANCCFSGRLVSAFPAIRSRLQGLAPLPGLRNSPARNSGNCFSPREVISAQRGLADLAFEVSLEANVAAAAAALEMSEEPQDEEEVLSQDSHSVHSRTGGEGGAAAAEEATEAEMETENAAAEGRIDTDEEAETSEEAPHQQQQQQQRRMSGRIRDAAAYEGGTPWEEAPSSKGNADLVALNDADRQKHPGWYNGPVGSCEPTHRCLCWWRFRPTGKYQPGLVIRDLESEMEAKRMTPAVRDALLAGMTGRAPHGRGGGGVPHSNLQGKTPAFKTEIVVVMALEDLKYSLCNWTSTKPMPFPAGCQQLRLEKMAGYSLKCLNALARAKKILQLREAYRDMKHARPEALENQLLDTLAREHIKPTHETVKHLFTVRSLPGEEGG